MRGIWQKYRVLVAGLAAWAGLCGTVLCQSAAHGRYPPNNAPNNAPRTAISDQKPSLAESITSTLKQGFDKFAELIAIKPPVEPPEGAVSLRSPGTPRAKLYVSVAQMYEQSGKLEEAVEQYRKALKHTPNNLAALLGYARLEDRRGKPQEAIKLYKHAAGAHPHQAAVFNNFGSFYARRGMFDESVASFRRAIQLQPKDPKYRNNLAIAFVEMGRMAEAFSQLRAVHDEAVAYYNLGYLLYKKGQARAAAQHFVLALRKNPSLVQARQMLDRLANSPMQARTTGGRPAEAVRLGSRPPRSTQQARPSNPLRDTRQPAMGPPIAPRPAGDYTRRPVSDAPLPPVN